MRRDYLPEIEVRLLLLVLMGLLSACSLPQRVQPSVPAPHPEAIAFTKVTVIDATGAPARANHTVVVIGDRIRAVGHTSEIQIPHEARRIDADGMYLIPGLWDSHVHLSFAEGEAEALLPLFLANGVTSLRDTGGNMGGAILRDRIARGEIMGPRIKMAGPLIESAEWLRRVEEVFGMEGEVGRMLSHVFTVTPRIGLGAPEEAPLLADSLMRLGVDFIKVRNVHGVTYMALAEATERLGIPLAAHTPRGISLAEAVAAGTDSFEHTETITFALGDLSEAERRGAVAQLVRDSVLVTPTVVTALSLRGEKKTRAAAVLQDTLNQLDPRRRYLPRTILEHWRVALILTELEPPMDWEAHLRQEMADLRLLHEEGVILLAGSDFGGIPMVFPGFSIHEELQLLVEHAGMTPLEALQTATRNPPMFFGMQDEIGTIQPGRVADLVLLRTNPLADIFNTRQIQAVVLNGRLLDRDALDEMLRAAERAVRE
jgi:imidazolonepropionase-like amidohydrolase